LRKPRALPASPAALAAEAVVILLGLCELCLNWPWAIKGDVNN